MNGSSPDDDKLLEFLAATVESIRDRMATKEDVAALREQMDRDIASLRSQMATREDTTAIRGDIERVHLRLAGVDRTLGTRMDQVDNQISRLRSVVYLLGKDQPEVLRLLGDGTA